MEPHNKRRAREEMNQLLKDANIGNRTDTLLDALIALWTSLEKDNHT